MKPIIPFALLGAFFAVGAAKAASTTPVGYVTSVLAPGQFNFVGLTVQSPSIAAGILSAESSSSVTASGSLDFTALLTSGKTYILELEDGTIQEITSWSGAILNTPEDISSVVTPNVTTFSLREAATVSSIFGANNSAGLTASATGDASTVDNVIVYTSPGNSVSIYYFDANLNGVRDEVDGDGWYTAAGEVADGQVIPYPDALIVQRVAGAPKSLIVSGEVKTGGTNSALGTGFNFVSSVAPVGLTLANSGLSQYLTSSATGDATTVDNVIVDVLGVTTTTYFYDANSNGVIDPVDGDGWYTAAGDSADNFALEGAFTIVNLGAPKPYKLNVPSFYGSL